MSLRDELNKLHEVQKLDYQIYQREQEIAALDSGEELKQQAIVLLKRSDELAKALTKIEAKLKDADLAMKSVETKRDNVHKKLFSGTVNSPKELTDLQKDLDMLKDQVGHAEEIVLEAMDDAEGVRAQVADVNEKLTAAKTRWQRVVAHTQAETKRLKAEIAVLVPPRAVAAAEVERMLLRRYDELRTRHQGIGMAVTGNNICPACHMTLTAQTLENMREGEIITCCDNCGRILGWINTEE
ncbi:MAG: C4-type zinc ribbon domain-containing protein [bacterium]